MRHEIEEGRWARRPGTARLVRVVVFAAPVLASFGAALAVRSALPQPSGLLEQAGSLAVLVAVSSLVLLAVDRVGRRALPLVTLLELSMLFPDRAPSRLGVARDAIRRRPVAEQLERVKDAGADPGAAAREILALVAAMSAHDRPTRGHAERVRMFTDLLAEQMKIPARDRDLLRWASILHDIGKLRVPATLLNKPAKPTDEEWVLLKAHPAHGAEMAEALLPWLGQWGAVIVEHHERYDGTGYPTGISGRDISLGARVVSVADAYDVMTAARAYKRPVSRAAACRELVRFSGTQFDPAVVRAMVAVGAPRLRRAQGLVAWIADLPLVATGTVPAATVARVVGAGALATGAVTGAVTGGVTGGQLDTVPRAEAAISAGTSASAGAGVTPRDSGRVGRGPSGTDAHPDDRVTADPDDTLRPAAGVDTVAPTASATVAPVQDVGPAEPTATSSPPSGSSGGNGSAPNPTATTTPSSGSGSGSGLGTVTGAVGTTVGTVTGTVGGVVNDPVGTVADAVEDPVGTVTGTVDTVGGLLGTSGSGHSGSGSSGSGSSGSGSSGSGSSGSGHSGTGDSLIGSLLGP